jgi:glycerol-3-phosphate acyltransferase PlsY
MSDVGLSPSFTYFVFGLLAAILVGAYLIGSIPFVSLLARIRGGMVVALALDVAKGFVPVLMVRGFARHFDDPIADWFVAAFAAGVVLGDCFSPWLRFKGGKGVATSLGAILGICWPAALVAIVGWIAVTTLTRYPSVGSMLGSLVAPVAIWFFTQSHALTLYGVFAALLIIWTHRENIARLSAGTERPINLFKG